MKPQYTHGAIEPAPIEPAHAVESVEKETVREYREKDQDKVKSKHTRGR
jgi:hypothetical protein